MKSTPFKSFWMAGYECADHVNKHGNRVDLLSATNHLNQLEADYKLIRDYGITTAREGVRWSIVEYSPYRYNWDAVVHMIRKGIALGIQQHWDICHFGFPSDITPLHPKFADRFEALCIDFIRMYRSVDATSTILVTPINEVSFLSWLGGEVAGTSPFCVGQGWEVKYHLMRAYIRGAAAMKSMDENVMIVSTEPLVHIIAARDACYQHHLEAVEQCDIQFQALDILCGYICPELGGKPGLLDVIGVNFYYSNQWIYGTVQSLPWAPHDRHEQWKPLHKLLEAIYYRYGKPIAITETSHPGDDRGLWLQDIANECVLAIEQDIPVIGICIYPIIDRPDWDYPDIWHHSGLWDVADGAIDPSQRILFKPLADALLHAQSHFRQNGFTSSAELAQDLFIIQKNRNMEYVVGNTDYVMKSSNSFPDQIICFSHLRWDFVYQRPQHLLTRMAKDAVVYYIEEPIADAAQAYLSFHPKEENVIVVVPHLPTGLAEGEETSALKLLLDELVQDIDMAQAALWYYTPMALKFSRHLAPRVLVFDCMDELSAFKFAPQELKDLEQELLERADVVFTGGASLFQAKKGRHHNIHLVSEQH